MHGALRCMLALAVAVVAATASAHAAPSLSAARTASVVDQRGERFTLAALTGRPTLVTFVATRCTDACPFVNSLFGRMQAQIERHRLRLQLLTLTLDPQYDTPFVMARLARALDAHATTWRVGSGSVRAIDTLRRAFGVVVVPDRVGVPEQHSSFVYLLDEREKLVRTFPLSTNLSAQSVLARRYPIGL